MADLPLKSIVASLKRWSALGLDHENPAHIAAYRLARQSSNRPRAEQVLAILESQKMEHLSGARMSTAFLLVPRKNFPQGLPPSLQAWVTEESELREQHAVPMDSDFSSVYIMDGNAPKGDLGRQVCRMCPCPPSASYCECPAEISNTPVSPLAYAQGSGLDEDFCLSVVLRPRWEGSRGRCAPSPSRRH